MGPTEKKHGHASRLRPLARGILASAVVLGGALGFAYATLPPAHFGQPSNLSPAVVAFLQDDQASLPSASARPWYTPLTIRPADFLLEDVTADNFFSEAELMQGHAGALRQQCSSLGLDAESELSEEEITEDAPLFFDTLEGMLGSAEMPPLVLYPELSDSLPAPGFSGLYFDDTVFVYSDAEIVLPHELAHVWAPEENWAQMLARQALLGVARGYWQEYRATGNKESGRRACVYGAGLWSSLAYEWHAAGVYLERLAGESDEEISPELMAYEIVPALALRYAFQHGGLLEYEPTGLVRLATATGPLLDWLPGWNTTSGRQQDVDFTALAEAYRDVLAGAVPAEYRPTSPLKPSLSEGMPKDTLTNILSEWLRKAGYPAGKGDFAP